MKHHVKNIMTCFFNQLQVHRRLDVKLFIALQRQQRREKPVTMTGSYSLKLYSSKLRRRVRVV